MSFTMDLRTREQQLIDLLLSTQDAITLQKQTDCMFNAQLNKNTKEGRLYFTIELGVLQK